MSNQKDLETRIRDLEAVHEIMNLEADYAWGADSGQPDLRASVFADDGVFIHPPFVPTITSLESIRTYFREQSPKGYTLSSHRIHNPHIVVNWDTAKGRFYFAIALTLAQTNEATWAAGIYEDEFVRTDQGWKIKVKNIKMLYLTPYDQGWAKKNMIEAQI